MWINTVVMYNLLKQNKDFLSKRNYNLINSNLSLILLYKLIPKKLAHNENHLFNILTKFKYEKINNYSIINLVELSLPYTSKKINHLYSNYTIHDIIYIHDKALKINTELLNFYETKSSMDLIMNLQNIQSSLFCRNDFLKNIDIKKSLLNLENAEFNIQKNQYKLELLNHKNKINLWSIYLNNCLDSYTKGRCLNVFCIKTNQNYNMKMEYCLKHNIINLIGIYKNGKPYACLELVDKQDKINQLYRKKNRPFELSDQHFLLSEIENILGKELEWNPQVATC